MSAIERVHAYMTQTSRSLEAVEHESTCVYQIIEITPTAVCAVCVFFLFIFFFTSDNEEALRNSLSLVLHQTS